jgi:hypothetical protein
MRSVRTMAAGLALLGAIGLLGGCGQQEEAVVEHPEGSVQLVETQPRQIGDIRVVAADVAADSAYLSVAGGSGPAEGVDVAVGDVVELKGHSFEIVDIVPDPDAADSHADGASRAAVWVVVD